MTMIRIAVRNFASDPKRTPQYKIPSSIPSPKSPVDLNGMLLSANGLFNKDQKTGVNKKKVL
jgi:hypothetical protein